MISDFCGKSRFSVEKPDVPFFSPGRPDWVANPAPGLEKTFRLWPHKLLGEGHYAAVLRRAGDEAPAVLPPEPATKCPPELSAFRSQTGAALPEGKLLRFGDVCYLVPQALPEVKGLRVLRAGLELGAVLKTALRPRTRGRCGCRRWKAASRLKNPTRCLPGICPATCCRPTSAAGRSCRRTGFRSAGQRATEASSKITIRRRFAARFKNRRMHYGKDSPDRRG